RGRRGGCRRNSCRRRGTRRRDARGTVYLKKCVVHGHDRNIIGLKKRNKRGKVLRRDVECVNRNRRAFGAYMVHLKNEPRFILHGRPHPRLHLSESSRIVDLLGQELERIGRRSIESMLDAACIHEATASYDIFYGRVEFAE